MQTSIMIKAMSEQALISDIVERLTRSYPTVPLAMIAEVVHDLHVRFDGARVREFVPLFVERHARTALVELAARDEPPTPLTGSAS
jgi:hypothetical protein